MNGQILDWALMVAFAVERGWNIDGAEVIADSVVEAGIEVDEAGFRRICEDYEDR